MKDKTRNQTVQVPQTIPTPNFTSIVKVTTPKMSIEGNNQLTIIIQIQQKEKILEFTGDSSEVMAYCLALQSLKMEMQARGEMNPDQEILSRLGSGIKSEQTKL